MIVGPHANRKRTLILGTGRAASLLSEALAESGDQDYVIIGAVSEASDEQTISFPYPVLGNVEQLEFLIEKHKPVCIIVAVSERRGVLPTDWLVHARVRHSLVIEEMTAVYERLTGKLAIDSLTPSQLIYSRNFTPHPMTRLLARAVSLLTACAGLLLLLPVMVLAALAIKLDSPGPIFFVQERVGRRGRCFRILKFRTMRPAMTPQSEWVRDNGDRITRVGWWLRRFRLDELPQLINILRGDMNLVGPRPHPVSNFSLLTLVSRNVPECGVSIPYYELRSLIRPGITGWAQVRYRYANDLNEEIEKLRYDLYYIKHYSFWLDVRIVLETIRVVLFGRGYGDAGLADAGLTDARTTASAKALGSTLCVPHAALSRAAGNTPALEKVSNAP